MKVTVDEITAISRAPNPLLSLDLQYRLIYVPESGENFGILTGDEEALASAKDAIDEVRKASKSVDK